MIALRTRVSLAAAVVLTVFIALTALALDRAFEESARSSMRERLFAQLYLVMAAAEVSDSGRLVMPAHFAESRLELPGSGLYATISDNHGTLLWRSPSAIGIDLPPEASRDDREHFDRLELGGGDYFRAALAIEWEADSGPVPLRFRVLEESTPFTAQMSRYRQSLWGWLGAMAVLLLLALVAALVWGLRPLRRVAAEVQAIESGNQGSIEQEYPRELKPLTDNINGLLQHERAQQARYQHALGDLAHSLKTPLAVLRGLDQCDSEHLHTLQEQVSRMDNIVHYQLQRAATAGRSALAAPLPIAPVAKRLIATLEKVYRERTLHLHSAVEDAATFRGDEGDLMELLGNLLDNACKWAAGEVWLTAQAETGWLRLRIEDDGPGIEPAQAEAVLARGVRLDEATPGHGIGLPMVRDIVEAYGGMLTIDRSSHGGARFTVTLPA